MALVQVKEILEGIIEDRPKLLKAVKESGAASLWERVVDAKTLKHSEPVKVKDGVLYVSASNPTWAQELSLKKNEILDKLNKASTSEIIKDIKFRAGQVRGREDGKG